MTYQDWQQDEYEQAYRAAARPDGANLTPEELNATVDFWDKAVEYKRVLTVPRKDHLTWMSPKSERKLHHYRMGLMRETIALISQDIAEIFPDHLDRFKSTEYRHNVKRFESDGTIEPVLGFDDSAHVVETSAQSCKAVDFSGLSKKGIVDGRLSGMWSEALSMTRQTSVGKQNSTANSFLRGMGDSSAGGWMATEPRLKPISGTSSTKAGFRATLTRAPCCGDKLEEMEVPKCRTWTPSRLVHQGLLASLPQARSNSSSVTEPVFSTQAHIMATMNPITISTTLVRSMRWSDRQRRGSDETYLSEIVRAPFRTLSHCGRLPIRRMFNTSTRRQPKGTAPSCGALGKVGPHPPPRINHQCRMYPALRAQEPCPWFGLVAHVTIGLWRCVTSDAGLARGCRSGGVCCRTQRFEQVVQPLLRCRCGSGPCLAGHCRTTYGSQDFRRRGNPSTRPRQDGTDHQEGHRVQFPNSAFLHKESVQY